MLARPESTLRESHEHVERAEHERLPATDRHQRWSAGDVRWRRGRRFLSRHERLPAAQQAEFTVGLRPLLEAAWDMACGDQTLFATIKQGLGEFYLSDYCHNDGEDAPDDADESAGAALLCAAEFAMRGCLEFAIWAGRRGEEAATRATRDSDEERAHDVDEGDLVHAELRRQISDLGVLAQYADDLRDARLGLDIDTISRLQRELRGQLAA